MDEVSEFSWHDHKTNYEKYQLALKNLFLKNFQDSQKFLGPSKFLSQGVKMPISATSSGLDMRSRCVLGLI